MKRTTRLCGGWDHAEVTAELLDLTGPIGGLNFQAAFASAEAAGRHIAG
ncbi:MAG: NAD(P)/FAD-dependent oxidoreductase [Verrucomicrobia bacterium]|nr:NAD(P)/FAD-dependent oxidoreductase [Verrucomicrobiota bacterium]